MIFHYVLYIIFILFLPSFYRLQTRLREGDVFTAVCLFTGRGYPRTIPQPSPGWMSGQYASYWKAFLFSCYSPQRSCEGYVFTPVCHSVHGGGLPQCMVGYPTPSGAATPQTRPPWSMHPPRDQAPPRTRPPHQEQRRLLLRTVCIQLECILVDFCFLLFFWLWRGEGRVGGWANRFQVQQCMRYINHTQQHTNVRFSFKQYRNIELRYQNGALHMNT